MRGDQHGGLGRLGRTGLPASAPLGKGVDVMKRNRGPRPTGPKRGPIRAGTASQRPARSGMGNHTRCTACRGLVAADGVDSAGRCDRCSIQDGRFAVRRWTGRPGWMGGGRRGRR